MYLVVMTTTPFWAHYLLSNITDMVGGGGGLNNNNNNLGTNI